VKGVKTWIEIVLAVIIILLLGWIFFFSGGGVLKQRKLSQEIDELRKETRRLRDANEALRNSFGVGIKARARYLEGWFDLIRDLGGLKCAIAGSRICQKMITEKYDVPPGPELLERILAKWPNIDPGVKSKLANELLVGEVGRAILRSMDSSASFERAASDAGVPVVLVKREVAQLQLLGYLDSYLKLTERGREALT